MLYLITQYCALLCIITHIYCTHYTLHYTVERTLLVTKVHSVKVSLPPDIGCTDLHKQLLVYFLCS